MTSSRSLRGLVVLTAVAAGLAHVPVTGEHLEEAPYMGWAFVLFTVGCVVLAAAVAATGARVALGAMVAWCGAAIVTYAATRLVAFPQLADDVGSWAEPWGVVSIACEAITVLLAVVALRRSEVQHA